MHLGSNFEAYILNKVICYVACSVERVIPFLAT
jgi:hypothetical protein